MPSLEEKSANAIEALTQLIAHLEQCNEYGWASRFYPIREAVENLEYDKAIRLFKLIPMPSMGGFLDLILCKENGHDVQNYTEANELLGKLRGAVSKSIGNLRVYIEYQIDHELVRVHNI